MVKTFELISELNNFAPIESCQSWDNSGWQINFNRGDVNRVMLALTATEDVVDQAVEAGCDLILTHHPVFFNSVKKLDERHILKAIENKISIYSVHTNLDVALAGVSDMLVKKAGFKDFCRYNDFVRSVEMESQMNLDDLILMLKIALNVEKIKAVNYQTCKMVKTIAFCAGAGGSFISDLKNSNIDVYVTGDLKYHDAICSDGLVVLDIGHFDSEKHAPEILMEALKGLDVEFIIAKEKNIWQII